MPWLVKFAWRILAYAALALAVIGAYTPVLPTVPFVLLAAYAALRGSPTLHRRLLQHPKFGPMLYNWQEHGAVSRRAKWTASAMQLCSLVILWFTPVPRVLVAVVAVILLVVALWLWRRPEPSQPPAP